MVVGHDRVIDWWSWRPVTASVPVAVAIGFAFFSPTIVDEKARLAFSCRRETSRDQDPALVFHDLEDFVGA